MNAIIIDDEPKAIEALAGKLSQFPDIDIIATATNGADGIECIRTGNPDILFLDIQLPDMTGLEILKSINEICSSTCHVVIYTAYDDYILPAFRNRAFDCLLKPIEDSELTTIMNRFYADRMELNENAHREDRTQKSDDKLLFYTNAEDFRLVRIREICVFRYDHDLRVWLVIAAGCDKPMQLKRNVNKEVILGIDNRFIQVSKRHIINLNYLIEVRDNLCRFYPPFDKIEDVKVGRLYRRKLINRYNSL